MKTICYISHVHFWHRLNGGMQRDFRLLNYLSHRFKLKMVFLGSLSALDAMAIAKLSPKFEIHDIGTGKEVSETDWISRFQSQKPEVRNADVYIVRGVENTYMLDALPEGAKTFLDSMDLVSERSKKGSSEDNSLVTMTREEESNIFRRFDQVICIQEDEAELAAQWTGAEADRSHGAWTAPCNIARRCQWHRAHGW